MKRAAGFVSYRTRGTLVEGGQALTGAKQTNNRQGSEPSGGMDELELSVVANSAIQAGLIVNNYLRKEYGSLYRVIRVLQPLTDAGNGKWITKLQVTSTVLTPPQEGDSEAAR